MKKQMTHVKESYVNMRCYLTEKSKKQIRILPFCLPIIA